MRSLLVGLALAYLVIMAFPNMFDRPKHHHAHSHAAQSLGIFPHAGESIKEIELTKEETKLLLVKKVGRWYLHDHRLDAKITGLIEELDDMLATSEPVRTFQPEDLVTVEHRDYGFTQSKNQLRATGGGGQNVRLTFGYATPDGGLRYVSKEGDPALYVMSGFLFEQYEALIEALVTTHAH